MYSARVFSGIFEAFSFQNTIIHRNMKVIEVSKLFESKNKVFNVSKTYDS